MSYFASLRREIPATVPQARRLAAITFLAVTAVTTTNATAAGPANHRRPAQRALAADASGAAVTEAESLALPGSKGGPFVDAAASGRRALLLWTDASISIRSASAPTEVILRLRGDQCAGAPRVRVSLGGRSVREFSVTSRTWTTTRLSVPAVVSGAGDPGSAVSVAYVNDVPGRGCDRNLRIDWIAVRGADGAGAPTPPEAPAPAAPISPATPAPATPSSPPALPALPAPTASQLPLFVDDTSAAAQQVRAWATSRPADAAMIERIASQPQAVWLGGWSGDVGSAADAVLDRAAGRSRVVFTLYNVPSRDCGQYSAGGLPATAYRAWIDRLAAGIAGRPVLLILEPDALVLTDCLSAQGLTERYALLRYAVQTLAANADARVYIDAGHAGWKSASDVASRLQQAGVEQAAGFALNTANFGSTASQVAYGRDVAARIGGKPFVIDTSRNGNGAADGGAWCNPAGRALGERPTLQTGLAGVDAFLWVKRPGESDGTCNGGPPAGQWWADYALSLARSTNWAP